ncbi:MAG: hypothetical protein R3207_07085, partial [Oceanospirillum sp.]|nr:hypothetical protein [Oceanospirillum sp.]
MTQNDFNQQLLAFLDRSPTPFHATRSMVEACEAAGFELLQERDSWSLKPGGRYVVTRNQSSVIAFTLPEKGDATEIGFRMSGAHTDSPCLKVKTNPDQKGQGYLRLGVEVYGGALLSTWFDRDLSIAGRVSYRTASGSIKHELVDFEDLSINFCGKPMVTSRSLKLQTYRYQFNLTFPTSSAVAAAVA